MNEKNEAWKPKKKETFSPTIDLQINVLPRTLFLKTAIMQLPKTIISTAANRFNLTIYVYDINLKLTFKTYYFVALYPQNWFQRVTILYFSEYNVICFPICTYRGEKNKLRWTTMFPGSLIISLSPSSPSLQGVASWGTLGTWLAMNLFITNFLSSLLVLINAVLVNTSPMNHASSSAVKAFPSLPLHVNLVEIS